jgi:hypothetical protein
MYQQLIHIDRHTLTDAQSRSSRPSLSPQCRTGRRARIKFTDTGKTICGLLTRNFLLNNDIMQRIFSCKISLIFTVFYYKTYLSNVFAAIIIRIIKIALLHQICLKQFPRSHGVRTTSDRRKYFKWFASVFKVNMISCLKMEAANFSVSTLFIFYILLS